MCIYFACASSVKQDDEKKDNFEDTLFCCKKKVKIPKTKRST